MDKSSQPPPYGMQNNPQGMPHPQMMQPTSVMAAPQMMAPPVNYGPQSQACVCPFCHANIRTEVNTEATTKTHGMALLLCCCLCWCCAWLPYVMDSCQNKNHYCPSCRAFLGAYSS